MNCPVNFQVYDVIVNNIGVEINKKFNQKFATTSFSQFK